MWLIRHQGQIVYLMKNESVRIVLLTSTAIVWKIAEGKKHRTVRKTKPEKRD